jgi:tRNA G18 (ribose-2'-O)-methylase SpoU
MRGYFGIGVEGVSKPFNIGNLFRSAHAFGASFVFTVDAAYTRKAARNADTSRSVASQPFYAFPTLADLVLPKGCALVGIELLDDAVELPSFHHPRRAAYVLGPERNSLSKGMLKRCDFTVKIPARFALNVGIAGVIVMYDRLIGQGRFAERPLVPGGPASARAPIFSELDAFKAPPPLGEVEMTERDGAPD